MRGKTLYVSDLDGTLLRSDETISERTSGTINKLTGQGLLFSYATARSIHTAKKVTQGLDAKIPLIVYNGAFIDGVERFSYIEGKSSKEILDFAATRNDSRKNPVLNEADLIDGDCFYITCIDTPEKLFPFYEKYREQYHCVYQKDIYSKEQWLEIMPQTTTKANAIRKLKSLLNCDRVVVFGDGINDLEMFGLADESYAVANASEKLKAVATGVIGANDDDGVAGWLEEKFR